VPLALDIRLLQPTEKVEKSQKGEKVEKSEQKFDKI
jgi:hypothetical protein